MTTIYSNNETININPTDDLVLYKEEFINSRIEKFLYAICALDFNDLPTPLSRIEELYKCLATGLPAPTFVPQSRVEKYLMAILGAYDASALPAPQSRTEVLLNKILLGDTDLSDIEWLKSRYEFLLAYIAKSGENDGEIDIARPVYFVDYSLVNGLTTLYNTIDYPVKSAVLKGQTLVNVSSLTGVTTLKPGNVIFIENTGMKTNTTYTIMFNCSNSPSTNFVEIRTMMDNTQITQVQQNISVGYNKFTIKTNASKETNRFRFKNDTTATTDFIFSELLILEGDYTNENIPYFEGMVSVKMPVLTTTGKNLFKTLEWESGFISSGDGKESVHDQYIRTRNYIDISPNTTYTATGYMEYFVFYDANKNFISGTKGSTSKKSITFTTPSNAKYLRLRYFLSSIPTLEAMLNTENMLELGEQSTGEYEPYKSTTVSCNEEVELRGIGDVKDELNLLTGELTQRISEDNEVLSEEVHKTVDLSTLDQDGKETKLSTFDDITYVTVSSEELVPTGEIDIARPVYFVDYSLDNDATTLYNTIEYPVKNAVLRGQTLVNLIPSNVSKTFTTGGFGYRSLTIANKGVMTNLKPDTTYLYKFKVSNLNLDGATSIRLMINNSSSDMIFTKTPDFLISQNGVYSKIVTSNTAEMIKASTLILKGDGAEWENSGSTSRTFTISDIQLIEYQDGMENWDIPYFTGMASVKMPVLCTTGKNLFDKNKKITNDKRISTNNGFVYDQQGYSVMEYFKINPNTTYILTHDNRAYCAEYDEDKKFIRGFAWDNGATITTRSNTRYIRLDFPTDKIDIVQIEKGSTATSFETHKSNILTCNEDVTLRSNGNICDELNLLTGQLTQRIDEGGEVLSQEVVKTVDLSTVDQDNKETELSTFDDITHVITSSEGLVPTGDITVATKNATDVIDAGIMSLRMDDISNSQRTLEESANAQSDDIDVTMLGVTDIYEQLL